MNTTLARKSKYLLGTLCLLLANSATRTPLAFATGPTSMACESLAASYAENKSADRELKQCMTLAFSLANPRGVRATLDGKLRVAAYRNMLFIRDSRTRPGTELLRVIAGKNTGLQDARAIALNEAEQTILVLNYSAGHAGDRPNTEVLTHGWRWDGNVHPIRRAATPALDGAVSIATDSANGLLYIAQQEQSAVVILPLKADANSHRPEGSTAPLGELKGGSTRLNGPLDLAVDPVTQELLVIDLDGEEVLVYPAKTTGNVAPKVLVAGNGAHPLRASTLGFSGTPASLSVVSQDGSIRHFDRAPSATPSPSPSPAGSAQN